MGRGCWNGELDNRSDRAPNHAMKISRSALRNTATRGSVGVFLIILGHKLTQYDLSQQARDLKHGHVNIYRLGHLMGALERVRASVMPLLDRDDKTSLDRLVRAMEDQFTDVPPVTATIKKIREYQTSGKLPALK